jgi:high-affinity Fe2+/Pb2+ permease
MPDFRRKPVLDMTPDGQFVGPSPRPAWMVRLIAGAVLVAVAAGCIAIAALAFWVALALIPIAIVAGLVAWAGLRFQLWRARRGMGRNRAMFRSGSPL